MDFFSLPMTSGPDDYPVGEDELGNIVYSTPRGGTYTAKQRPANRESVLRGVWDALASNPTGFARNALLGAAEGVWQGVEAPGNALAGDPVTYGDVAATAMDWAIPNAPGVIAGRHDPNVLNMGAPRSTANAGATPRGIAQDILDLRAQGRASEVTDEMMAGADPEYMFLHTPLPMDEASRMARAGGLDAFHGASRLDRVEATGALDPSRASSGPMPFFTDDTGIASNYAKNKSDTSFDAPDSYGGWFKIDTGRGERDLDRAWWHMRPKDRDRLTEVMGDIGYADDYETIIRGADNVGGAGRDHWDYTLKSHRGNALKAAQDVWLDSGNLFGNEGQFSEVLDLADVKHRFDDPNAVYPGVLPAKLSIKSPFKTDASSVAEIYPDIIDAQKTAPKASKHGVDLWDKNATDPEVWVSRLEDDMRNGTADAWTTVPDWVTDVLRRRGHDGIEDTGGKMGGNGHNVLIPFDANQVRSRFARFDPEFSHLRNLSASAAPFLFLNALYGHGEPES